MTVCLQCKLYMNKLKRLELTFDHNSFDTKIETKIAHGQTNDHTSDQMVKLPSR